jgi:hypothetical protein
MDSRTWYLEYCYREYARLYFRRDLTRILGAAAV